MSAHPVAMFDVTSPDPARAATFYAELFGWGAGPEFDGYRLLDTGAEVGAAVGPSYGPGDLGVKVYMRVDDLAASIARAVRLGGAEVVPPSDLPEGYGRFAVVADLDGFAVGLWSA
ncbi:VOC family protein [Nocardia sp. NPDC057353]|uniref:VOC family protein n=1 Tax=Nocardia sp. NPDC057353 TaxID=3346104 RepID=UPI00363B00BB